VADENSPVDFMGQYTDDFEGHSGQWKEYRMNDIAKWETTGVVDSVDTEKGTITLWISDFDELQTVPITPDMPEWLFKPETMRSWERSTSASCRYF